MKCGSDIDTGFGGQTPKDKQAALISRDEVIAIYADVEGSNSPIFGLIAGKSLLCAIISAE